MANNLLITKTTSKLHIYYIFSVAFDDWIQAIKITKLKLCFDAMALLAWWSAPELKLITKMSTTKLAIIFCSNATGYAFPVQFWSDNHNPWTKFHQNRYSRWWCKVTRKFVDTTRLGTFKMSFAFRISVFFRRRPGFCHR